MSDQVPGGEQLEGTKRITYTIIGTMSVSPAIAAAYFHFFNRTHSFEPASLTAFWVLLPIAVLAAAVLPRLLPSRTPSGEQAKSIVCMSLLVGPTLLASVIYQQVGPMAPLGFGYVAMALSWLRIAPDWSAWEGQVAGERSVAP
jgi:hypothetical protein